MTTPKNPSRQDHTRKQRFLERQGWIDWVQSRRDLTPAERLIGGRIGWHKNLETGQCNPGYGTLAKESGYPIRTVIRAVAGLERKGCITITRGRGGSQNDSNAYTLIPQNEAATPDTMSLVEPKKRAVSPVTKSAATSDISSIRPVTPCHPNLKEEHGEGSKEPSQHVQREKGASLRSPDTSAAVRAPLMARSAACEESKPDATEERKQENNTGAVITTEPWATAFDQLRATWVRPWPDHDDAEAQAAFNEAVRENVSPQHILAAAAAWVEAADAPRFLPKLSAWLADRCFEREPPKKRGAAARERYARKPNPSELALEYGRRMAAEAPQ
jgi:hypothetical protein